MHIWDYGMMVVVVDISIIHACILKFKSNIHYRNITLHYTGNKFLQPGLEGNKYNNNRSLNHVTVNHAVHYATLQNTELTIVDKENVGILDQLKWSNLALFQ